MNAIERLRNSMREKNIDAWLVNSADFHDSEYAGEYFRVRSYLSGFTGSAGTLVVLQEEAGLWTDGRYFVQAGHQLEGSGITLYKMGQKGVPTILQFLADKLPKGGCLGFDGRTAGQKYYLELKEQLKEKEIRFSLLEDLGGDVWENRPALSCSPMWILEEAYSGLSTAEKLKQVRKMMAKKQASVHLLTSLDDIAWLFNVRGSDIPCNPVVLANAAITEDAAYLFVQEKAVSDAVRLKLEEQGVTVKGYEEIYDYAAGLSVSETVMLDSSRVNCALFAKLPAGVTIADCMNPETELKAVKNPVEQANLIKAHVKDGVAVVQFIYWLKKNVGKMPITEMQATSYIDGCRAKQEGYIDLSFNTIAAYGSNAAMCHYSATEETDTLIKPEGFFLVDSGGQYYEGTTDITRTIAVGPLTDEQKLHFTLVLKGMIALANAHFAEGCTGAALDILARGPLWQRGLDFNHGTGHGVGYLLNVHEGPNRIHWDTKRVGGAFKPGMLTSDEPGFYLEGAYGIRTENLLLCEEDCENAFGHFLKFKTVTLAPIDRDAIDLSIMTADEIKWLDEYHQTVYRELAPMLSPEEAQWLSDVCRPLI